MAIEGTKEVDLHRDEPMPPGFSAQVVWFIPNREGSPCVSLFTAAQLCELVSPYKEHERLIIDLDRDGGRFGIRLGIHCGRSRHGLSHDAPRRHRFDLPEHRS